jgi:hypothetical protein
MKNAPPGLILPTPKSEPAESFTGSSGNLATASFYEQSYEPRIRITERAHGQMLALITECDMEISWLATCTRDGNSFTVREVFIPHQECTPVSTTISCDGEAALLSELMAQGRLSAINDLTCWGHSHVRMQVNPSNVDEMQTVHFLRKARTHFVRLIGNKFGDLNASVYLVESRLAIHQPLVVLERTDAAQYTEWARDEIAAKVVKHSLRASNIALKDVAVEEISVTTLDAWLKKGYIDPQLHSRLRALSKRHSSKRRHRK